MSIYLNQGDEKLNPGVTNVYLEIPHTENDESVEFLGSGRRVKVILHTESLR